ncbi:MAG: hypothetical protein NC218_06415 [Acetobacter sp.]|nr:hypothetical protein [Acetobacter sp.]
MKDFGIKALFFAEIIIGVIIAAIYMVRFRFLKYCQSKAKNWLSSYQNKDLPFYYSSYAIKQGCQHDFFNTPYSIVDKLIIDAALIPNRLSLLLEIKKALIQHPKSFTLTLLKAHIYLSSDKLIQFRHIMQNLNLPSFTKKHERAQYYYFSALNELYETDMDKASKLCSKALKIYQKLGFMYEEAECYLLLSQIYRITGIFDIAETMLKEADKRFRKLKINAKKAECMAYFGLISFGREQYNFAIQYLSGAVAIAKQHKLTRSYADINNWLGLAFYMIQKRGKAERSFLIALKKAQTKECTAYAAEMLSRIRYQNRDYKNALKYVDTALSVSDFQVNPAGFLENLYIKAEIFFAQQNYTQSKKILTHIIRKKLPPATSFYPANAYTLLGIINLKENNLNTAKNLFKQAVDLEHSKNRLKGAAIDYNNLAEIARQQGYTAEAENYLRQALSYATKINDNELENYLKTKLN